MFMLKMFCILLFAVAFPLVAESSQLRLPFRLDKDWSFEGSGQYQGWSDRRGLFVLFHPWSESQSDCAGSVFRGVRIPADWRGRVRVYFYMTDDYHGMHEKLDADSWLGQMSLVGHRFKQLLVDGEVVWEKDVADPEGVSEQSWFSVLLPESVKPGDNIRVEFRLIDKIGSMERLEGDYRHIGTTDGIEDSDPWRFMTHLYVGDVTLTPESVMALEPGEPPSAARVRELHAERWPLKPYGEDIKFPVRLSWEGSEDAPSMNCAIRCGIPFPPGKVKDISQIVLRGSNERRLPIQASPMNYWPDGSLRWVEINTIASAEDAGSEGQLMLYVGDAGASVDISANPVIIFPEDDGTLKISAGGVRISTSGNDGILLDRIEYGDVFLKNLEGEIEIGQRVYKALTDSVRVLARGPVRGEIELSGEMRSEEDSIGRFVFRLAAFSGRPYVQMMWRMFNDRNETLKISRFELIGESEGFEDIRIQQLTEDKYEVIGEDGTVISTGERALGLSVADEQSSFVVTVRHFQQQFPKAIEWKDNKLRIALFEPSEEQSYYLPTPGEAKRHEIWIGLWDGKLSAEEMSEAKRYFSRPGRLFNAEYFCKSGGFGYAAPHDEEKFSDLDAYMKTTYGDIAAERFYKFGIRNWGDQPYQRDKGSWCNGYYDRQQGFASEYIMSGDPRWFDRLEATVRHIMDIDVCHSSEDHPDQVGSIYACYAVNHTDGGPWEMMQRTKGMMAYWRLTGDIDARDTALEVADSAIRADRGIGRSSVRDHGGILYCLMAAYDETGDEEYLDAAKRVAHDAMGRIESRRGCYSEVHGNISYRGNVPWMVAQLAQPLYEYYRCSGDVDAAIAVTGLAESILMENCTRGVPGDVYGYSHNPHFKKTSGYHILIAPAILYAFELTEDEVFLKHGRAMYEQTIREKSVNAINNCYWNTPTLLYYLSHFGR